MIRLKINSVHSEAIKQAPDVVIPSWIKDVAVFWCNNEIEDSSFIEAIQHLNHENKEKNLDFHFILNNI